MLISGVVLLVVASFGHSYISIASGSYSKLAQPEILYAHNTLLHLGWIVLFLVGIVLIFIANWVDGLIALLGYWIILSPITAVILKNTIFKL